MLLSINIESSVFGDLYPILVNKPDQIITEDFKYAIFSVNQIFEIDNFETYFPGTTHKTARIVSSGLCAIDLRTSKEVAALSPNGVFVDYDKWWEYVYDHEIDLIYSTFKFHATQESHSIYLVYINSMNIIDGSHF